MKKQRMMLTLQRSLLVTALYMAHSSAWAETLVEAVTETINSNPEVLFSATRKETLNEQIGIAKAGYFPKVDLALGYGYEWTDNAGINENSTSNNEMRRREASLSASQMLYDGYATKSAVDAAESGADAGGNDLSATSEEMALSASQVYLEVLRQQQLLDLTRINHQAHQDTFDRIKRRYDSGLGSAADMEQARSRLALANSNLIAAEGNLWEAEINYERVVGHRPVDLQMPTDKCCVHMPSTPEDAVKIALTEHPALLAAFARHEQAMAGINGAKAAFHPKVDLELGASHNHGVDGKNYREQDAYAMLRARYNAYRGGADTARVDQMQYLSDAEREAIRKLQWELEANARSSWNQLNKLYQTLPQLDRHASAAEQTRNAYRSQFDIGQRSLLDLLDSENEYFTATTDRINGEFDEWYARYRLLAHVGKLLKALEVAPDFETISVAGG